ncbi:unnamed protein product [Closterium sp. NIES-64]|nr:unnamed protein product [Closterium sp. NIES-64]
MAMADQAAAKFPSYTPYCSAGPYVTAVLIPLGNCRAVPRGNNARIVRAGNSRFIRLDLGRPVRGCQRSYRFQLVNFRGRVVRGPVTLRVCRAGKPGAATCGPVTVTSAVPSC